MQSEVTAIEDAKGSGWKNLAVRSGERLHLIRTDMCPKKKWLVRNASGVCEFGEK